MKYKGCKPTEGMLAILYTLLPVWFLTVRKYHVSKLKNMNRTGRKCERQLRC